jgi:hypothetical protein
MAAPGTALVLFSPEFGAEGRAPLRILALSTSVTTLLARAPT